jgi:polar amino acid transport system ATP-binding protein
MSNANPTAAVAVAGLRKSYGSNEVLKGIDLQVQPGEVIAIIGKSGSGKSTLLRCINGLETFQHGSLTVQGQALVYSDPAAMRTLRQQVGMIFQSFNLFPHGGQKHPAGPGLGQTAASRRDRSRSAPSAGACRFGRKV